jgi:hypothetical protein
LPEKTFDKIEEILHSNKSLSEENRNELLGLLSELKTEMKGFSAEQKEHAELIMSQIENSAYEAVKEDKDEGMLQKALDALSDSVRGFEVSHPKLVAQIDFIATKLANSGI